MKKIPDEQVADMLLFKQYLISIPQMFSYTAAQLEHVGRYSSGNKNIDHEMGRTKMSLYATVPQMCDYFNSGSPIWFNTREDVLEIYEIICRHLALWYHVLTTHIGVVGPPLEDFVSLDNFASTILPLTEGVSDTSSSLGLHSRLSVFNRGFKGLGSREYEPAKAANKSTRKHETVILKLIQLLSDDNEYSTNGY